MEEKEIIRLVLREKARTEDERLSTVGKMARPLGLGLGDEDSDEVNKEIGQSIVNRIMDEVKKKVCPNAQVKKIASSDEGSSPMIILIVVDIAATFLNGPAVFAATASVLTYGVKRICAENWAEQGDS